MWLIFGVVIVVLFVTMTVFGGVGGFSAVLILAMIVGGIAVFKHLGRERIDQ